MKYIIACLLGLGMISGVEAQDKTSTPRTFSCYYVDETTFVCNMNEAAKSDEAGVNTEGSAFGKQGKGVNPQDEAMEKEGAGAAPKGRGSETGNASDRKKKEKYLEPEKESDTGVLDESGQYGGASAKADSGRRRLGASRKQEERLAPSKRDSVNR